MFGLGAYRKALVLNPLNADNFFVLQVAKLRLAPLERSDKRAFGDVPDVCVVAIISASKALNPFFSP